MTKFQRNIILSLPMLVLSVLVFVLVAHVQDIDISWRVAALGAVGWWIALLLRIPVGLAIKASKGSENISKYIVAASGPCEEITRLVFLLILGRGLSHGYSLGIGWAAIEAVYSVVQSTALSTLQLRKDKKAKQALRLMHEQGLDKSLEASSPFLGVFERLGANALHLGFSLLLVTSPLFVLVTIPLHSLTNTAVLRYFKKAALLTEMVFVLIALVIFAAAFSLAK